jgi:hypothetical protein
MHLTVPRRHSLATALGFGAEAPRATAYAYARDSGRRTGGGTEDRALYSCSCGFAFKAKVTTTVGCPHCGQTQAW